MRGCGCIRDRIYLFVDSRDSFKRGARSNANAQALRCPDLSNEFYPFYFYLLLALRTSSTREERKEQTKLPFRVRRSINTSPRMAGVTIFQNRENVSNARSRVRLHVTIGFRIILERETLFSSFFERTFSLFRSSFVLFIDSVVRYHHITAQRVPTSSHRAIVRGSSVFETRKPRDSGYLI